MSEMQKTDVDENNENNVMIGEKLNGVFCANYNNRAGMLNFLQKIIETETAKGDYGRHLLNITDAEKLWRKCLKGLRGFWGR